MFENLLLCWFDSRFGPGLELIATYVDDVEADCDRSVAAFLASDEGFEKPAGFDAEGSEQLQWVTTHKGLSDDAWCLPELFEHYFPTLKRGSALTALCGYVEHELNELCRDVEKHMSLTVGFDDMKGLGITRAELYLRRVGTVFFNEEGKRAWKKMQDAFLIRNAIVHAGGRSEKAAVEEAVKRSKYLNCVDGEIGILAGYLRSVVDDIAAVGRALDLSLKSRFDTRKP